jgi:hypothetical protein
MRKVIHNTTPQNHGIATIKRKTFSIIYFANHLQFTHIFNFHIKYQNGVVEYTNICAR